MNLNDAHNIDDLRRIAQRRLPRIAYDFLAGGAEDGVTLRENRAAFERIRFLPRTLVDVSRRSQKAALWDWTFNAPFGIAPTGASGLYCYDADVALGRAALLASREQTEEAARLRALRDRLAERLRADVSDLTVNGDLAETAPHVLNVKLMKSGVSEALDIVAVARSSGMSLMIGGMLESTLAMSMSACFAAGQGGFEFVDLDTPLFLASSPFTGGFVLRGALLDLSAVTSGHGVSLAGRARLE